MGTHDLIIRLTLDPSFIFFHASAFSSETRYVNAAVNPLIFAAEQLQRLFEYVVRQIETSAYRWQVSSTNFSFPAVALQRIRCCFAIYIWVVKHTVTPLSSKGINFKSFVVLS